MVAALLIPALDTSTSNRSPTIERTPLASNVAPSGVRKSALIASARPPFGADVGHDRFRILRRMAIVNQDMCTAIGKRGCRSATDSAGGSRNKRRFVSKTSHNGIFLD